MINFKQFIKESWHDYQYQIEFAHKHLSNHQHDESSLNALKNHAEDSEHINSELWKKHEGDTGKYLNKHKIDNEDKNTIKNLDKAIKSQKMPYEVTVHSGIIYDPREKMNSEYIVHHPAYLSTSLDKERGKGFAMYRNENPHDENGIYHSHTLKIKVPKGHPGAYLGDKRFPNPDEKEVLLPRGLNLKHIHTEDEPEESYCGKRVINHIHHMEIVK